MAASTKYRIVPPIVTPIPGLSSRKEFHVGRPGRACEIWDVANAGGLTAGALVISAAFLKGIRFAVILDSSGVQIAAATYTVEQPPAQAVPTITFAEATLGASTHGTVILYGNH